MIMLRGFRPRYAFLKRDETKTENEEQAEVHGQRSWKHLVTIVYVKYWQENGNAPKSEARLPTKFNVDRASNRCPSSTFNSLFGFDEIDNFVLFTKSKKHLAASTLSVPLNDPR